MPQKIQRAIPGLRELTLTGTISELQMSEIAVPTLDIGRFLCAMTLTRESAHAAAASVANAGYAYITVPSNELWHVLALYSYCDILDGDQACSLEPLLEVGAVASTVTDTVEVAASTARAAYIWFPQPLILSGGHRMASVMREVTVGAAGSVSLTTACFVHRLGAGRG